MKFWWSKKEEQSAWNGKIEVFSRHCSFSSISQHKKRFPGFSHEKCYRNLVDTLDCTQANLTLFLDTAKGAKQDHFLKDSPVIELCEGTESGAFLRLLDHIVAMPLHPETILYLVEDDYLHRPGWLSILREGFTVPDVDYVTLYDHRDKYHAPLYEKLTARLFHTASCHWRTTPSTTQTFACRFRTLLRDLSIHQKYSLGRSISQDHAKFVKLQKRGALLISSIPGFSTHVEEGLSSPCVEWL
jgi:hypothetical protein